MPSGVRMLGEMGVPLAGEGMPFVGIRYLSESHRAEARFSGGSEGLGIRRIRLSQLMLARARELGVGVESGLAVSAVRHTDSGPVAVEARGRRFLAQRVVAADGLNSRVRRMVGIAVSRGRFPRAPRYGTRRHFRMRPWSSSVDVHWNDGVEAYVTPVSSEEVGIAFLFARVSGQSMTFAEQLHRFPELEERLRGHEPVSDELGRGPFRQRALTLYAGRVVLVGDAAFYLDAISGEGLALGFRCAKALVTTLTSSADWSKYESVCREASRRYRLMTEFLLLMAASPALRRRAISMLSKNPEVFRSLLGVYHDELPLHSIGLRRLSLMLRGLLSPA